MAHADGKRKAARRRPHRMSSKVAQAFVVSSTESVPAVGATGV
jgi:hypothetical protein